VVPVLVQGAELPAPSALPEEIRPLTTRNAIQVDSAGGFDGDLHTLAKGIEGYLPKTSSPSVPPTTSATRAVWSLRQRLGYGALGLMLLLCVTAGIRIIWWTQLSALDATLLAIAELLLVASFVMGVRPPKPDAFIMPYVVMTLAFVAALGTGLAIDLEFEKPLVAGSLFALVVVAASLLVAARFETLKRHVQRKGAGPAPIGFTARGTSERVDWTPYFTLTGFLFLAVILLTDHLLEEPGDKRNVLLSFAACLMLLLLLRYAWFVADSRAEGALDRLKYPSGDARR